MKRSIILLTVFLVIISSLIYSQDNTNDSLRDPIDFIIALDRSNSMVEEMPAVREFLIKKIKEDIFIGDNLIIIPFYGQTPKYEVINVNISSEDVKQKVIAKIKYFRGNGDYTDLANALDTLVKEYDTKKESTNRKVLIIITDGKHQPPPWAKHQNIEDFYNHELYKNEKREEAFEGWKVIYLDLGGKTDPESVDDFTTNYVETDTKDLSSDSPSFTTLIDISGEVKIKPINAKGNSAIIVPIDVKNFNYKEALVMTIKEVKLDTLKTMNIKIQDGPYVYKIIKDGSYKLVIPVNFSGDLKPAVYQDSIIFTFEKTRDHFKNKIKDVKFRVNNFLQNNLWLFIIILILIIALLAFLIYLLYTYLSKDKIKFRVIVEESPLPSGKDTFKAIQGKYIYLNEDKGISVEKTRSLSSVARIGVSAKRLRMTVINKDKVPVGDDVPRDALGFRFVVKNEKGQDSHVKFEKL